jgi:acyl carrier protein
VTTTITLEELQAGIIQVMLGLASEWEYSGDIAPETRLFADMDLQSLDFVILSTALVRKYGRIPFDELYTDLSERGGDQEITVREFTQFVYTHLASAETSGQG